MQGPFLVDLLELGTQRIAALRYVSCRITLPCLPDLHAGRDKNRCLRDDRATLLQCCTVSHSFLIQNRKEIFFDIETPHSRATNVDSLVHVLSIHPEYLSYNRILRISRLAIETIEKPFFVQLIEDAADRRVLRVFRLEMPYSGIPVKSQSFLPHSEPQAALLRHRDSLRRCLDPRQPKPRPLQPPRVSLLHTNPAHLRFGATSCRDSRYLSYS